MEDIPLHCRIAKVIFRHINEFINTIISLAGIRARCLAQAHNLAAETPYYRKPWRICVAVLLERKPVISREFNELEHKFAAYQNALEFEQSCLSEHEAKKIKMAKGSKLTKKKPTEAEEQKRLEFEQEFGKIEVHKLRFVSPL